MRRYLSTFLFILSFSPLANAQTSTSMPQIAVGLYHYGDSGFAMKRTPFSPMVLIADEQAQNWKFVKNIDGRTADSLYGMFTSVSCNGNFCAALGSVTDISLMTSHDRGETWGWVKNIVNFPNTFLNVLSSVSCNGNGCVVAGFYFDMNAKFKPLLLTSDANGKQWSAEQYIVNAPESARLSLTACNETNCLAAGVFKKDEEGVTFPLIVYQEKNSKAWRFAENIMNGEGLPNLQVSTLGCSGDFCLIGGKSYLNEVDSLFMLASDDAGATWTTPKIQGLPEMSRGSKIKSVSCSEERCIAVGQYNTELQYFPLIVVGNNQSKQFTFANNISNLPADFESGTVEAVSCASSVCAAAGYYVAQHDFKHLLIVTEDKGDHWKVVDSIAGEFVSELTLHAASCIGETCTVAGAYTYKASQLPAPIIVSKDRGKTWSLVQNYTNVPKNIDMAEIAALRDSSNVLVLGQG